MNRTESKKSRWKGEEGHHTCPRRADGKNACGGSARLLARRQWAVVNGGGLPLFLCHGAPNISLQGSLDGVALVDQIEPVGQLFDSTRCTSLALYPNVEDIA